MVMANPTHNASPVVCLGHLLWSSAQSLNLCVLSIELVTKGLVLSELVRGVCSVQASNFGHDDA